MDPNQAQSQRELDVVQCRRRAWPVTKIALITLSIIFCGIVLGISIALAADPAIQSYIVVWTAPQAGAALLWTVADLITTIGSRGIHPGAHVAIHLLLWMGFGVGLGLTAYILSFVLVFTSFDERDTYSEYYENYYGQGGERGRVYYSESYVRSMESLVAFLALLIIVHFSLFVRACVETARHRKVDNGPIAIGMPLKTSST
ncbi:hypothetical protein F5Y04DRAFT_256994 [Hypomontagnella monticulosa]|nr:hypothetical protein F5Y04DRAFT_256994 [Hypomontagnella monticulosa]